MKNMCLILSIVLMNMVPDSLRAKSDSTRLNRKNRLAVLYMNLDARLKNAENAIQERTDNYEQLTIQIDRRLERMEDKFDRYFLWGYGTLMSIFMVSLAWFMNKFKPEYTGNSGPPRADLKVSKSRLLSSS